MTHLREQGYVVIRNALSEAAAAQAVGLTWDYLEGLGTGIDRTDTSTWDDDRWPIAVHGGIIPSQGIGHCAAQWFIRSQPAVKASFAKIWNDDDLLVSFDGMALWRPVAVNPAWETNRGGSWLHIDQHPIGRPGFHCVQGLINLLPTTEATGGNVVVPGSHRLFSDIPDLYTDRLARIDSSIDHFRFPADDERLAAAEPIMAHLDPGDMLLWDSRTAHCSGPGTGTDDITDRLTRAASLVCMMPKKKSSPEIIKRRWRAVDQRTSTTNWSDRFINADRFPAVTGGVTDRYVLPPVPILSDAERALVG